LIYIFLQRTVESGTQVFQLDRSSVRRTDRVTGARPAAIMLWRAR